MANKQIIAKNYILLQILLVILSAGDVLSKKAGQFDFLSLPFCLCYGGVIMILAVYAIGWQQIIKTMPLSVAYANRAVTVAWGMIWGFLIYSEKITAGKIIGSLIVISGVILYAFSDNEAEEKKDER